MPHFILNPLHEGKIIKAVFKSGPTDIPQAMPLARLQNQETAIICLYLPVIFSLFVVIS